MVAISLDLIIIDHPKAHYISFRTCEILKDLGLHKPLEDRLDKIEHFTTFNYATHVLGGKLYGRVNHFDKSNEGRFISDYKPILDSYKQHFTYAYPNHFS